MPALLKTAHTRNGDFQQLCYLGNGQQLDCRTGIIRLVVKEQYRIALIVTPFLHIWKAGCPPGYRPFVPLLFCLCAFHTFRLLSISPPSAHAREGGWICTEDMGRRSGRHRPKRKKVFCGLLGMVLGIARTVSTFSHPPTPLLIRRLSFCPVGRTDLPCEVTRHKGIFV